MNLLVEQNSPEHYEHQNLKELFVNANHASGHIVVFLDNGHRVKSRDNGHRVKSSDNGHRLKSRDNGHRVISCHRGKCEKLYIFFFVNMILI